MSRPLSHWHIRICTTRMGLLIFWIVTWRALWVAETVENPQGAVLYLCQARKKQPRTVKLSDKYKTHFVKDFNIPIIYMHTAFEARTKNHQTLGRNYSQQSCTNIIQYNLQSSWKLFRMQPYLIFLCIFSLYQGM